MNGTIRRVGIDPWLFLDGVKTFSDELLREGQPDAVTRRQRIPLLNLWATEDAVTVDVDLPGVEPEKVEISVERNVLTLKGETAAVQISEGAQVYRKEKAEGHFERAIELPFAVDAAQAKASSRNGVIRIVLPKAAEAKVRRIQVEHA